MGHSAWRIVLRLGQCLVLVSTLCAGALAYPRPANADWDGFRVYTYGSSSCASGDYKDPLNYFFNTTNENLGLAPYAWAAIYTYVGWDKGPMPAGDQYMWSTNSGCHIQDFQLAENVAGPKYHTRIRQGPWINGYGYATAAPMHHDSLAICWPNPIPQDVADSFNSARDYAKTKFSNAGFGQGRYYIGNTQAMAQCDGRLTASDGYVWENHGY